MHWKRSHRSRAPSHRPNLPAHNRCVRVVGCDDDMDHLGAVLEHFSMTSLLSARALPLFDWIVVDTFHIVNGN